MRGGLQHSLVAADDRQKRAEPFFAAVAGRGFDRLHRFAAQITRNLHRQSEQVRFHELGGGLKVDFSGTTTYYDGKRLPYDDNSFDHVLCTEVLEHVTDPRAFLTDLSRVLRVGGTLILTVPWSARIHHLPHDYGRFTRFGLVELLNMTGFTSVTIQERGNDIAVIANKLIVLLIRLLRPRYLFNCTWTWLLAAILLPLTCAFLSAAHVALLLHAGSRDDPLGYGVIALKAGA